MAKRASRLLSATGTANLDETGGVAIVADTPEKKLWAEVMHRALKDINYLTRGLLDKGIGYKSRHHLYVRALKFWPLGPMGEILEWITSRSTEPASLAWICDNLTESPDELKEAFRNRIAAILRPIAGMLPTPVYCDKLKV